MTILWYVPNSRTLYLTFTSFCRIAQRPKLTVRLQRQVNWILWAATTQTALVIIPEEAELLIPLVRDANAVLTHLLTYAGPVTRKMLHFNGLGYYAVPALPARWKPPTWLTIELGIFAGRLYFQFEEYCDICKYL